MTDADGRTLLVSIAMVVPGLALAVVRIAGHKSIAFQAVAHLFTGVLFGAYFGSPGAWWWPGKYATEKVALVVAVVLSVVELACFLIGGS